MFQRISNTNSRKNINIKPSLICFPVLFRGDSHRIPEHFRKITCRGKPAFFADFKDPRIHSTWLIASATCLLASWIFDCTSQSAMIPSKKKSAKVRKPPISIRIASTSLSSLWKDSRSDLARSRLLDASLILLRSHHFLQELIIVRPAQH